MKQYPAFDIHIIIYSLEIASQIPCCSMTYLLNSMLIMIFTTIENKRENKKFEMVTIVLMLVIQTETHFL